MKVIFALMPVWDAVTPPLSLAYMKSSLEAAGHECRTMDFSTTFRSIMVSALGDVAAEQYVAERPELYRGWAEAICAGNPDVVGFTLLISNINTTELVAREVRRISPQIRIISGGPSLTAGDMHNIKQALSFSDSVIEGEGEEILPVLLESFTQNRNPLTVHQQWLTTATDEPMYTGALPLPDIDALPLPDFSDFDRSQYICPDRLPILFSRGCILNCTYCTNKWNHRTQRSRLGKNVFQELKRNIDEYGIKEFMFNDDSLISHVTLKELEVFCNLAIAEDCILPWSVYGTRIDRLLNAQYVDMLRRSGMYEVALGVESFSSRVQREMGKSSTYEQCDRVIQLFANQGIKVQIWIIFGYPTETEEDFETTLKWLRENPNLLSHVTANAFGPNQKYFTDRPNAVKYYTNQLWDWAGQESTLARRKSRFLRLMDVLEEERQRSTRGFTFHAGDPLYVKYFNTWDDEARRLLKTEWETRHQTVLASSLRP